MRARKRNLLFRAYEGLRSCGPVWSRLEMTATFRLYVDYCISFEMPSVVGYDGTRSQTRLVIYNTGTVVPSQRQANQTLLTCELVNLYSGMKGSVDDP